MNTTLQHVADRRETEPAFADSASLSAPSTSAYEVAREKAKRLKEDLRLGRSHGEDRINWITAIFMGAFHVGAVIALLPMFWSWKNLAAFVVTYFFAINVGIGMCYHRLLTHRGYRVPVWLEGFLTVCGTMALEGGPIFWVATHRVHHQHSDHDGDPHTPREGTWWAHAGWIVSGRALHSETALLGRYAPDLTRSRMHVWLSKYHWLPLTLVGFLQLGLGAALASPGHRIVGAIGMMLWGTFLRVTLGLHATWLVNSATHMFGSRRFETTDDSRNSWWVALLTGGEGWHNNHHAHPVSARHGLAWYELDLNFYGIWVMEKLGLAKKVQIAKFDPSHPKPAGVA